jgi:hypothetical protein
MVVPARPARFTAAGIHSPIRAIPQFPRPEGLMPNSASTASTIAPTAITVSTASETVPAAAGTAGIVNTPAPAVVPMTKPVADVRPSAWVFR